MAGRAGWVFRWGVAVGAAMLLIVVVSRAGWMPSGEPAPLGYTLKDMHGQDVRLADFRGRPILINFWATWCSPCRFEIPELVELSGKYRDRGLVVLGISTDDTPEQLRQFADEFKITYPILVGRDRDDVADALGLRDGIPMSVFIKADGTIYGRLEGIGTKAFFDKQIQALF